MSTGIAAFSTAMGITATAGAQGPTVQTPTGFQPARHPQDDWFDQVPGVHRFFFDATSANGAGEAITFASNYYAANKGGYGLEPKDLAVVICLRHYATVFAFNDEIWQKYGSVFSDRLKFTDPKTRGAPTTNVYLASDYGMLLPNRGTTLDAMASRGTQFAVCDMASRAFAGMVAAKVGAKSENIYQEFRANSIPNTHFVPAGIVAVNRAQERGYSIQYIG